jgi:6-phosphogluconolactonase (cycloisomerase 2 family)
VSGLTGSGLVLQDNGGDNLTVAAKAASFTFKTALTGGAAYSVKVLTQPTNPVQTCTVSAGSGTVAAANVTSVSIACTSNTYSVGGHISGLTGGGLVLQDNGGDNLAVAAKATSFTFKTALAGGAAYSVKVLTQPTNPAQTCTVSAGSGNVAAANVTTVSIACTNNTYSVGGSISGLTSGGLVLQDNGGDNLNVSANATSFTFKTALLPGAAYSVSVLTQPAGPAQKCKVSAGTGSVVGSNITNVSIACRGVGQFVYVVNSTDGATSAGDVSGFAINSTDGTLTPMAAAPVAADLHPSAIVVDASGDFVYVSNSKSSDVSVYQSDPSAGALTLQNQAISTDTYGTAITVSPSNQYVFVGGIGVPSTDTNLFGFTLDQTTGLLTADPNSPYPASNIPQGLAVDPTSQFLFVTASQKHALHTYTIGSVASTLLTEVGSSPVNTASTPYGVIASPLGNSTGGFVFVTESGAGRVAAFSYDNLGNLTELTKYGSPWPSGLGPEGIAIDPTGVYLYVANYNDGTVSSFSINANGSLTALATGNQAVSTGNLNLLANPGPMDVKVDPTGRFVYVVNYLDESISLFTSASGMLTLVATYPTGSGPVALAID